ncbi:MAG: type II toxin-antitoxin system VapC family toxin [Chloroflexota bacterium]
MLEAAIPPGELLLLDTTVIVSYFTGTEAVSPVAAHLVDQLVAGGRNPAVVSAVTTMELLVQPLRERDDALYRQIIFFLLNTFGLKVSDADFAVVREAAWLRANYSFKPPDALIVGTGPALHARHFVTNDGAWERKLAPVPSLGITVCYLEDWYPSHRGGYSYPPALGKWVSGGRSAGCTTICCGATAVLIGAAPRRRPVPASVSDSPGQGGRVGRGSAAPGETGRTLPARVRVF